VSEPITVAVVDDHPLYRSGVLGSFGDDDGFRIVGEGGSADEAVALARAVAPQVMMVDLSMPGGGIAAVREISRIAPKVACIMLTVSEADDDVIAAMEAGARGYVPKGVGADELLSVVRLVAAGDVYVSPGLAGRLLARLRQREQKMAAEAALDVLTEREEQILRLVADGLSNKEIGRRLDLQEKTIKHYMTGILQKLNVRNRVEAALRASELLRPKSS